MAGTMRAMSTALLKGTCASFSNPISKMRSLCSRNAS